MNRESEGLEAAGQRGRRGIEIFVTNAVNATLSRCPNLFPVAIGNNFLERDAIPGTAPGRNENLGIKIPDLIR